MGGKKEKHQLVVKVHKTDMAKAKKTVSQIAVNSAKLKKPKKNSLPKPKLSFRRKKEKQEFLKIEKKPSSKPEKKLPTRERPEKPRPAERPPRIISIESEKNKRVIMWIGVSFFMLLLFFFWVYNSYHLILKNKPVEQAGSTFEALNNDLEKKIQEFKSDIEVLNDLVNEASTTEETDLASSTRDDLFRMASSSVEISSTSSAVD